MADFAKGGAAGLMATCVVQPIDLVKTRLQLVGEGGSAQKLGVKGVVRNVIKEEGIFGFYNGLSAGLFRQATYTTTRLGLYTVFMRSAEQSRGPHAPPLPFVMKAALGSTAGAIAAIVGNPAEVALVRMTADGSRPPELRRGYRHVFDALFRVFKEEGVRGLWKGTSATAARAAVVNGAQLGGYSQGKQFLLGTGRFEEGISLHFTASLYSGFLATCASLPMDTIKTRVQNSGGQGGIVYAGPVDCAKQLIKAEGPLALWKGFTPFFFRLAPHTILTFIFLEQINNFFPPKK